MKISTRGEYGIRAMLYIASQGGRGGSPRAVTSREIAREQSIPEPYLRQILALLAKDRLIQSSRGPQGGHTLARAAHAITLRDILVTLEGQTTSIDHILALPCAIHFGTEHCAIREVFLKVKESVEAILVGTSLADLAARQQLILEQNLHVPFDVGHTCLPVIHD